MTDRFEDQVGPDADAADNAAAAATPEVADDVLGRGARGGEQPSGADPGDAHVEAARARMEEPGTAPRTGAETPVDPEDLVRARGQDVTPVTLDAAVRDLAQRGEDAVLEALPGGDPGDPGRE